MRQEKSVTLKRKERRQNSVRLKRKGLRLEKSVTLKRKERDVRHALD